MFDRNKMPTGCLLFLITRWTALFLTQMYSVDKELKKLPSSRVIPPFKILNPTQLINRHMSPIENTSTVQETLREEILVHDNRSHRPADSSKNKNQLPEFY